ncbi:hypothetical protein [Sphingomonas sp.]|jgi:hypothetical protein|uniref:hypothetical protein n=1 Tax=Sphingomonas sp. TaxID=28214 RepID=UPI002ED7B960
MTRSDVIAITGPIPDRFLVEILEATPTPGELVEAVCRVRADDTVPSDAGAAGPRVARLCAILESAAEVERDPLEMEDLL